MLVVKLYENKDDLFNLDFLKKKTCPIEVICPQAFMADTFRHKMADKIDNKKINVITINRFIKDEYQKCTDQSGLNKFHSKAGLLLYLGVAWKQYFPNIPFERFFQVYNIFTDLRGLTLNFEIIEEVIDRFDSDISKGLEVFWRFVDSLDIVDEHKSYQLLTNIYRENDNHILENIFLKDEVKNIIFWGFGHLSSGQIDLINALSIRHDVYVPFPRDVLAHAKSCDWISWLVSNLNVSEMKNDKKNKECKLIYFTKNRLNESLLNFLDQTILINSVLHDGVKKNEMNLDIYLGIRDPRFKHLNEISLSGSSFKVKNKIFDNVILSTFKDINHTFFTKSSQEVETYKVIDYLDGLIYQELTKPSQDKNFRKIKCFALILQSLKEWSELSTINEKMGRFDLKVLEYVSTLNLPRTYFAPLIEKKAVGRLRGLEEIDGYDKNNLNIICATRMHGSLLGLAGPYGNEIMKILTAIGPIYRREFDFQILKHKLQTILSDDNSYLFIEEGLPQHDLAWNEIIDGFKDIKICCLKKTSSAKAGKDLLDTMIDSSKTKLEVATVSKLQTYIDCPRKYYFKHIDLLKSAPILKNHLLNDQLGILEHKVIEIYMGRFTKYDSKQHRPVVKATLDHFLMEKKIVLDEYQYQKNFLEIENFSKNGIESLLYMYKLDPEVKFSFEVPISNRGLTYKKVSFSGRIDCLCDSKFGRWIIDFKRSSQGIPSLIELENFQVIQIWFYLNHLLNKQENAFNNCSLFGYFNLSDISNSLIFCQDQVVVDQLLASDIFERNNLKRPQRNFEKMINDYDKFESDLIERILSDDDFYPSPRNIKVCEYCVIKNICKRGVRRE